MNKTMRLEKILQPKKFKREKWLQFYETESQKNISQIIMHN